MAEAPGIRWRLSTANGACPVLLDLMLAGPAGAEACRSLRQRPNVLVIMLTAKGTEVDMTAGLGLGADDYVTKPFSRRERPTRIGVVLRRKSPVAAVSTPLCPARLHTPHVAWADG